MDEVTYGTMISVLPRFASRNQIELLLNIEDGNEINSDKTNVDDLPQVGRTLISTIARVPQGKSLLIGGYTRDTNTYESRKIPILGSIPFIGKLFGYEGTNANNIVRVFLIEPREIDERMMNNANEAAVDARAITQQMAKNKEKTNKFKINKGQLAVKIMASILAIMMVLSVCATFIYYIYSAIA